MIKIITAIGTKDLFENLLNRKEIKIMTKDIQYKEGILEILNKIKDIDYIIINELLPGTINLLELIKNIKIINKNIKIIIIIEKENKILERDLMINGVYKIFINNKNNKKELFELLEKKEINYTNEELKEEINKLKEMIKKKEIKSTNTKIQKKYIYELLKKSLEKIKKIIIKSKENKTIKSKIICICGTYGSGKSIFTVLMAYILKNKKILIIDLDLKNQSIHTILGLKKFPRKNIEKMEDNIEFINSKNKKINYISEINFLLNLKEYEIKSYINMLNNKYDLILIDTPSEITDEKIIEIIKLSEKYIFLIEPNLLEIKKAKLLLDFYLRNLQINNKKINIILNKTNQYSINKKILEKIFFDLFIIESIEYNKKYNLIINKSNGKLIDKKTRKKYNNIIKNLFI